MKATKYLSLAALALMGTLASCQSDDEAAVSFARPDNAVGINVSVGSLKGITRSNPASTDPDEAHLFNLGDQVCVSTEGQDPVLFQCQNADQQTWAEAVSGKFLLWTQSEMTFQAYYPATTGTSMTAFNLPADQSSVDKIALADYMTRQQVCNNENGTDINLNLERKTARVIVRIAGFNDQYFNHQKTVSNVRIYSEASGISSGNPTGSSTEIQPYAQGDGGVNTTYTALVVPGWGDSGADFVTLTDGANNNLSVKGIPELEAGNSYTFNLTVGKNTIQVQSVTVQDWTTGTTLAGGQATEAPAGPPSWKLTLSSPAKDLYITANGGLIAQHTLDVASTEFTVEMPELTSQTVNIVATDGSGNCWYCTQENMSFAIGQTYQSSPTMTALGTESSADVYKMTGAGTIPAGKTVVLSGVNISNGQIACSGNATIILMGTNSVTAAANYAAIKIGDSGTTLTITGSGSLTAQGGDGSAGIGTDRNGSGGNIVINGGTVTATGGNYGAGIGTGLAQQATNTCGDITINGGTVTATGRTYGAGIGTGFSFSASNTCGNITIGTGVTRVTATKGNSSPNSIGKGSAQGSGAQTGTGTITIGGDATTYAAGVTTSPFTYPAP